MRIHSLEVLPALAGPAAVLVNSDGFGVNLSIFESRSVFFRKIPELLPVELPLVVVNPTLKTIEKLNDKGKLIRQCGVEFWVDSTGASDLLECLKKFDDLAVSGASTDSEWFKIGVRSSVLTDRSSLDLVVGLSATLLDAGQVDFSGGTAPNLKAATDLNLRAELIRIAARVAKPVKPYLPASVVHLLYKVLGVLR